MRTRARIALAAMILPVVAAVLLLGSCGGGTGGQTSGTPSAASSSGAGTPSADMTIYSNRQYHFSLAYDAGRFKETDQASTSASAGARPVFRVGFAGENDDTGRNGMLVSVYKLNQKFTGADMDSFEKTLEQLLTAYQKSLGDSGWVGTLNTVTINGLNGYTVRTRYVDGETQYRSQMVFLVSGDIEYLLQPQAAASDWQGLVPDYTVMVRSFKVTR